MPHGTATATTRDTVLAAIRTAPTPPTVEEIARELGLHHNSVRLHTAALREAGQIAQGSRAGGGAGARRSPTAPPNAARGLAPRDYRLLASLLLAGRRGGATDPRHLGVEWGRRLAAATPRGGDGGRDDDDDDDRIVAVLDELGFEPVRPPMPTPVESRVELRNCPFLELVDREDGAVCAIHAGMLDGLVEGSGTSVDLLPFTTPRVCTVRITAGERGDRT